MSGRVPVSELAQGGRWYRVLSYYFQVSSNSDAFEQYPDRILGRFAVDRDPDEERRPATPGIPPVYSLAEMEPGQPLRFRVLYNGDMLYGSDAVGPVLDHFFWHVNTETIRQTGDYFLIHAGAVRIRGHQAMLLPGTSGSGKSTTVTGLVRDGFAYLSDEAAAIDPVTRRVHPYARAITLKPDVVSKVFPELLERRSASTMTTGNWHVLPEDIGGGSVAGPCDVRWIVMPRFQSGTTDVDVEAMSRAEAALELGRNSMSLARYGRRALTLLADVVRQADCYRITFADLDAAIGAVRRLSGIDESAETL